MSGRRDGPFLIGNAMPQKEAGRLGAGGREMPSQARRPLQTPVTLKPALAACA